MSAALPNTLAGGISANECLQLAPRPAPVNLAHLSLLGQEVQTIEIPDQSDFQQLEMYRDDLAKLMDFALVNQLEPAYSAIKHFLDADLAVQATSFTKLSDAIVKCVAEQISGNTIPFSLTSHVSNCSGSSIGVHVEPKYFLYEVSHTSPDPLLTSWWSQFLSSACNAIKFSLADGILGHVFEMQLEELDLDEKGLNTHLPAIQEAIESKCLDPIKGKFEYDQFVDDDEAVIKLLRSVVSLKSLYEAQKDESDEQKSFTELQNELTTILNKTPRLRELDRVKLMVEELPHWITKSERLIEIGEVFEEKGDVQFDAHALVWGHDFGDADDLIAETINDQYQHMYENCEEGVLSIDITHPDGIEALKLWSELADSFVSLSSESVTH